MMKHISMVAAATLLGTGTVAAAVNWDFESYADVSTLKFGSVVLNVGARDSDENRDFNNKRYKFLPYGETTTIPYQESYCLNVVHYAPNLDAKARTYKIANVADLPSGITLSNLHVGSFTPTASRNSGRYPDYCFTWPDEATELHLTVVATPFRSDKEIVLRRAPM